MLALAAARLGFKAHIYCPDSGPAFDVAARTSRGGFDDFAALAAFAAAVDVVTYEFENVAVDTARHLAALVPVRPSARALEVAQDRLVEKQFIAGLGIAVAPFRAIDGPGELSAALAALGGPAILKTRRLGYDGKGQASVAPGDDAAAAWQRDRRAAGRAGAAHRFRAGAVGAGGAQRSRRAGVLRLPAQHPRERHPAPLGRALGLACCRSRPRARHCRDDCRMRSTTSACWRSRCSIWAPRQQRPSG